jgi:hypothetical protein
VNLLDPPQQLVRQRRLLVSEQHLFAAAWTLALSARQATKESDHHSVQVRHVHFVGVLHRRPTRRDGAASVDDVANEIADGMCLNHEPE